RVQPQGHMLFPLWVEIHWIVSGHNHSLQKLCPWTYFGGPTELQCFRLDMETIAPHPQAQHCPVWIESHSSMDSLDACLLPRLFPILRASHRMNCWNPYRVV